MSRTRRQPWGGHGSWSCLPTPALPGHPGPTCCIPELGPNPAQPLLTLPHTCACCRAIQPFSLPTPHSSECTFPWLPSQGLVGFVTFVLVKAVPPSCYPFHRDIVQAQDRVECQLGNRLRDHGVALLLGPLLLGLWSPPPNLLPVPAFVSLQGLCQALDVERSVTLVLEGGLP